MSYLTRFILAGLCFFSICQAEFLAYEAGIGCRTDTLTWSIGAPDGTPNILSELEWKKLKMIDYSGEIRGSIPILGPYFRLTGHYGKIYSGYNIDSDYDANDRQGLFLKSRNDAGKGEAFDLAAVGGYCLGGLGPLLRLYATAGYSLHELHLRLYDGDLVYARDFPAAEGPFDGLHSNYRAKWYSPFAGFDVISQLSESLSITGVYEKHWGRYRGTGHWNLSTELVDDYRHRSYLHGYVYNIAMHYHFSCLYASLKGEYVRMKTTGGQEYNPLENNETVVQPLNCVKWTSYRLTLAAGCSF